MTDTSAPPPLTPLEIASGVVVGTDRSTPALPAYDGLSPRAALEAAFLPALLRAPCVVAFSGGRDSSAMLAIATHIARKEGLPAPNPVTMAFPDEPEAHEDEWQRLVIDHLGITEWERITIHDELDLIGPHAQAALRAHGPLFPFNAYTYLPMFPFADGGTLVTGLDGDGLLRGWARADLAEALARRRPPTPRDALRLALHAAPRVVREAVVAQRLKRADSWLTPGADAQSRAADAAEIVAEPARWDERVDWWQRRRYLRLTQHFDDVLGHAAGIAMAHPLLDPTFLAAIAHVGGRHGPGTRTAVMRMLLPDLLPDALLARRGKASFNAPFFNRYSREFVARWDGTGVDPALVDVERLRAAWSGPSPPIGAAGLLQATWLAAEGAR